MSQLPADGRLFAFFQEGPATLPDHVAGAVMSDVRRTRQVPPSALRRDLVRFAPLMAAAAVVAIVAVAVALGWAARPGPNVGASQPPASVIWEGPVRAGDAHLPLVRTEPVRLDSSVAVPGWGHVDGDDAARRYVDITQTARNAGIGRTWQLTLADRPPSARSFDPTRTVISYGLTLDNDRDGVADHVIGISNEAPTPGEFRIWVTDLATGETEEQVGQPLDPLFPLSVSRLYEEDGTTSRRLQFSFWRSHDLDDANFYAWASVSEDGDVVAWDYAPDAGWLTSDVTNP